MFRQHCWFVLGVGSFLILREIESRFCIFIGSVPIRATSLNSIGTCIVNARRSRNRGSACNWAVVYPQSTLTYFPRKFCSLYPNS